MKAFILLIVGVWIGMLIGISFVEAPLKFQAPNITLTLGLGIGQLVFAALNKFEIVFSIALAAWLILHRSTIEKRTLIILAIPIILVALQTFWLLPVLDLRVEKLLAGQTIPDSHNHLYYIAMEVLKVILLIVGFLNLSAPEN